MTPDAHDKAAVSGPLKRHVSLWIENVEIWEKSGIALEAFRCVLKRTDGLAIAGLLWRGRLLPTILVWPLKKFWSTY
jgi:hypothetical protein